MTFAARFSAFWTLQHNFDVPLGLVLSSLLDDVNQCVPDNLPCTQSIAPTILQLKRLQEHGEHQNIGCRTWSPPLMEVLYFIYAGLSNYISRLYLYVGLWRVLSPNYLTQ